MPSNVKFSIRASQIEDLNGAMNKETKMEEIMLETDADPDIILGRVQREMDTLTISNQGASSSRRNEDQRTRNTENQGIGGGILKGVIPNVRNDPTMTQETKQRMEIAQMNRTIKQMQNELTRLRRNENFPPNPRMHVQEQRRNPIQEQRIRNDGTTDEFRQRAPRVPNPNVVVLEDVFEDQNIDQEVDFIQEENLESVQTDECESSMYIFDENEENDISQDNVVQTRAQINKTKDNVEKREKRKSQDQM
jgi:hypothetical protein